MRTLARAVALVVFVGSSGTRAEEAQAEHSRGPMSAMGLTLLALGVGGAGLGIAGVLSVSDARGILAHYTLDGVPTPSDASVSDRLEKRIEMGTALAAAGWAIAGVGLAAGITLLLVDVPAVPRLAVIPIRGGGLISYALAW